VSIEFTPRLIRIIFEAAPPLSSSSRKGVLRASVADSWSGTSALRQCFFLVGFSVVPMAIVSSSAAITASWNDLNTDLPPLI
jgi:hypothetical protein